MRPRPEHRRSRLLDYRPVLANPRRSERIVRPRCHAPDRKHRDCRPAISSPSGAPRRQEPADRMQTAALLHVFEFPSARCPEQFKVGSLILIDVFTDRGAFNFSLTPKGYQAGIAQIRAWGYRTE